MGATIAVLSQKGGTGKTTSVRTLTDVFRRIGLDVLAVDLDPQANLSDYFDIDPGAEPTMADVLSGRATAEEAIHDGVIPANLSLAEAELMLAGKMGRELTLRRALAPLRDRYDLILLDCPPSLGLLAVNALVAADHALLSTEAQYFAMQGVEQALEVIELARDGLNPDLDWLGVVFNIADMRTVHSREAFAALREHIGSKLFDATVRQSIAYAESAERAVSILDHRPDLGADYVALADELLARLKLPEARARLEAAAGRGGRPGVMRGRATAGRVAVAVALIAGAGAGAAVLLLGGDDDRSAPAPGDRATVARQAPAPPVRAPFAARLQRRTQLRARPGGRVLRALGTRTGFGSPRVLAVVGRRPGWLAVLSHHRPGGRAGWIPTRAALLLHQPYALHADVSARRVVVRREGKVVRRLRVAVGRPGTPTPTGRFAVTDLLRAAPGSPYGCCALALTGRQHTLAQGWRGGDRLALHGTPDPASVGRAVSGGCLRAPDADMRWLLARVHLGATVTIRA